VADTGGGWTFPEGDADALAAGWPRSPQRRASAACAPIAAARGPGMIGTDFAAANRTTFSRARGLASSATTTHQHVPACNSFRTASTPTTTRRPR
jgi:hypothetical protein